MKKIITLIIAFLLCVSFVACDYTSDWNDFENGNQENNSNDTESNNSTNSNGFELPASSEDYENQSYEDALNDFEAAGFTNIKLEIIYDLITGWLTSDGEIEKILVNGSSLFTQGDIYPKDTEIIIVYHTWASDKPQEDDDTPETGNVNYSFDYMLNSDEKSYTITKYKPNNPFNEPTEVIIPESYNGLPITSIGSQAFYARTDLEKVVLPESLLDIESYAFYHCDSLYSINFPVTLRTIEEYAFEGCDSLTKIEFTQPIGIGFRAFNDCNNLQELVITASSFIEGWAFADCEKLSIVNIPGVTSIEGSGFRSSGIVTLTVSDNLKVIEDNVFSGCSKLETMYIYGTKDSFAPSTGHWWNYNTGDYEIIYLTQ